MPYLTMTEASEQLHWVLEEIAKADIPSAGALNLLFSELAAQYLRQHGQSYATMNDISGAYTESLAEFRRRVIGPYEQTKVDDPDRVDPWDEWEIPYD